MITGTLCIFCCNLNFGVLCHSHQYHGDQFTKPGVNPRHIGDRVVWAVRSNDLTHWTTRDLFLLLYVFAWLHCVLLLYIIYFWFQVHCIFCCNLNLNFWCFTPLSAIFQLYHGDQFTKPGANARRIGDRLVWAVRSNDLTHWTTRDLFFFFFCCCMFLLDYIVYYYYTLFILDFRNIVYFLL